MTGVDGENSMMQQTYETVAHSIPPSNTTVVDPDWATDDIYMDVVE